MKDTVKESMKGFLDFYQPEWCFQFFIYLGGLCKPDLAERVAFAIIAVTLIPLCVTFVRRIVRLPKSARRKKRKPCWRNRIESLV